MKLHVIWDQAGNGMSTKSDIIPTKYKSTANLNPENYHLYIACKLATATARSDGVKTLTPVASRQGNLTKDKYKPGDFISTYQYVVSTPGCILSSYGQEANHNCFQGGTIYSDTAWKLVWVTPEPSLPWYKQGKDLQISFWRLNLTIVHCQAQHWIGTVLQKFKACCGTTVYVSSVNFHMSAVDICLKSP